MNSEFKLFFPWHERALILAIKWMLRLPSDEESIKFCLAASHCGWPELRRARRQAAAEGKRVEWRTVWHYLPQSTVEFVSAQYENMMEGKTQCYEG
jgi:hypothetical protein